MACPAAKSAVVIPAVRKGLCNQRVRMVQDIMLAHLFGAPAGIRSAAQACSRHTHPSFCGIGAIKLGLGGGALCALGSSRGTPTGGSTVADAPPHVLHTVPYL